MNEFYDNKRYLSRRFRIPAALTDQVLNQVDNLKALYATAAEDPESFEQVSSEISAAINNISESVSSSFDGHLDGLIQEVFKAVEDKKSEVEKAD